MLSLAAFLVALAGPAQAASFPARVVVLPASADTTTAATATTSVTGLTSASAVAPSDSGDVRGPVATRATLAVSAATAMPADTDTVVVRRRRPHAVELSDAAVLRLRIHRYAAYTIIPLFIAQSIAGNQLYQADKSGERRPDWAKSTHSVGAAALGGVFTLNTVTGLWALWDQRENQEGRARRWAHTALMLASDAGFTWTGIKLAHDAKNSQSSRNQHRNLAYASMGTALVGYGIMFFGNR